MSCSACRCILPLRWGTKPHREARQECRCALEEHVRRCGLYAAATLAHLPYSVAQHRGYGSNLRRYTRCVLWPCGVSVDYARRHLHGRYARLLCWCYIAAPWWQEPPRDHRHIPRWRYAQVLARGNTHTHGARGWRIYRDALGDSRLDDQHPLPCVGGDNHRLLLRGYDYARR